MSRKTRKQKRMQNSVAKKINNSIALNADETFKNSVFNEVNDANTIQNGLSDALGIPQFGNIESTQLSQADTLFKNLRWYMVSNMRQLMSQLYTEIGLIKTIVDVPVEDGLRGGVDIKTKQLDEEQIQDLQSTMEQNGDLQIAGQAMKWNRLFGGGAVIVMSGQDFESPLNWDTIGDDEHLEFRAVDMWELYWAKQNTNDYSEAISESTNNVEHYDYYGHKLHNSRVFLLKGEEAPSFVRPRLRGWGMSVVETTVRSINQYLKATDLTFEVLDEFKLDIFKIKGLTAALLHKEGAAKIRERTALANYQKNYQNALTMDAEDDYVQKQLSFAGLSDAMAGIRMQVASDLRMPMTKLFGISAAGFSSGEDDIENYNATIESGVRVKAKPILLKVVKIRCLQKFGFIPDDLTLTFQSLRVLSSEQEENVKTQKFSRVLQARQAGELTREEFRDSCNKDELLPVQLDADVEDIDVPMGGDGQQPAAKMSSTISSPTISSPAPTAKNSYESDPWNFKGKRVAVVGVTSGDEILTGLRRDTKLWTSPAGHIDKGEHPKDGAIREVYEESGIRLLAGELKPVCAKMLKDKEGKDFAIFVYSASIGKQKATAKNDPDKEVSKWKWVKISCNTHELKYDQRHAGRNDEIIKHVLPNTK